MKIQLSSRLIALFIFLTSFSASAGGGWTQTKKSGFLKFSQSAIFAENIFSATGSIDEITPLYMYTSSIYSEYGITDRLTTVLYVPFFVRSTLAELKNSKTGEVTSSGDEMNAFGDMNVALKYGIIKNGPIVLSGSLMLGIPTGETSGGVGGILQSGDGEFNQMVKIEASHSFYPKPFYASLLAGFNNRTQGFSDELHFGAEVGVTLNKFVGILKFYNLSSLYNGISDEESTNNSVFSNNTEYFSFTPEILYSFSDGFGVNAAAGLAFSAKRILAAPNLSVGVFIKW